MCFTVYFYSVSAGVTLEVAVESVDETLLLEEPSDTVEEVPEDVSVDDAGLEDVGADVVEDVSEETVPECSPVTAPVCLLQDGI